MSIINEDAVKEIYQREGFEAAETYLISHENLPVQEAVDYLFRNVCKNAASTSVAALYATQKPEPIATFIYYCLKCNRMEDKEVCTRNAITRFFVKVKEKLFV